MTKLQMKYPLMLLLTAVIWGAALVAQSVGMDFLGPFTFTSARCVIGSIALLPCMFFLNRAPSVDEKAESGAENAQEKNRLLLPAGVICGTVLCFSMCIQQFGIMYTTVGKAGFITTFYIIIVPILGLFFNRKCSRTVWAGVALALAGLYFLCMTESFSIQLGDLLMFLGALLIAVHIMIIDHFAPLVDGVKLSFIQFIVCSVLSGILMFLFENPGFDQILAAWQPLLYMGVLSTGLGYTLQTLGQRGVNPTAASLILSLEAAVAALAGYLILNQQLSFREIIGCILMSLAILLAQIPAKKESPESKTAAGPAVPAPRSANAD